MTESDILRIWNGPTSQCNKRKILEFAANLQARLRAEGMAQQEPVLWMSPDGKVSRTKGTLFYIPLYAAPATKPAAQELDAIDAASKELK